MQPADEPVSDRVLRHMRSWKEKSPNFNDFDFKGENIQKLTSLLEYSYPSGLAEGRKWKLMLSA